MLTYSVPYFSQELDVADPTWRSRACGITALKMMLEYWHSKNRRNKAPTLAKLITSGLHLGAYVDNVGWSHQGLVNVAAQLGYAGQAHDLAKLPLEEAWQICLQELAKYPILVSVWSGFDPKFGGGHIAVLTSFGDGTVYINDPEAKDRTRGHRQMPLEKFLVAWKRRFITIYPHNKIDARQ